MTEPGEGGRLLVTYRSSESCEDTLFCVRVGRRRQLRLVGCSTQQVIIMMDIYVSTQHNLYCSTI